LIPLWPFIVIVALTGLIMIPNALYAFRNYLANRNLIWLTVYFIFLLSFAGLVVHVTTRTIEIVQKAKEILNEPDIEVPRQGP